VAARLARWTSAGCRSEAGAPQRDDGIGHFDYCFVCVMSRQPRSSCFQVAVSAAEQSARRCRFQRRIIEHVEAEQHFSG
jgi:mRNA-degrading endonuclease toxin of MazEF toxin-antitoxin module